MDVLTAVLQAPVNTILIIAGVVILFFALFEVGKGAVRLRTGKANIAPIIVGAVLIVGGLLYKPLNTFPAGPTLPPGITIGTQTPLPPVEEPSVTQQAQTPSIVLTNTPTLATTPTRGPVSLTCLERWWLINTAKLPYDQETREPCAVSNYRGLGFSTSADGFLITLDKFKAAGIFGISTGPLQDNVLIRMKVKVSILYTSEFWVGLSNSQNPETPGSDVLILAIDPASGQQQIPPGSIRFYKNALDAKVIGYDWSRVDPTGGQSNRSPFNYDLQFRVTGGNVEIRVNNVLLDSQIVNFPRYLFIGFRNKSTIYSTTMYITVTDLQIETGN